MDVHPGLCAWPYLVLLVFGIMAVWMPVDISRLDGIVPGANEPYMVEAKLVEDNVDVIFDWYYSFNSNITDVDDNFYNCPCSTDQFYSASSPNAQLRLTGAVHDLVTFNQQVQKFVVACNGSAFDLETVGGRKAAIEAYQFTWEVQHTKLVPEPGSMLLTRQAWYFARLTETRKQLKALGNQAFMRLRRNLGLDNWIMLQYTRQNVSSQALPLYQLAAFLDAYGVFAAALLLKTSAEAVDGPYNIHSASFLARMIPGCSLPANLSRADWPLELHEYHQLNDWTDVPTDNSTDPYGLAYSAYFQHCDTFMCSKITKKGAYLRAMQGVAVFGGMWGIISDNAPHATLAILVFWQCLFLGCVVGHQQSKKNLHHMPSSAGGGKGCGGSTSSAAATPVCQ